jgi:hypothetical protein
MVCFGCEVGLLLVEFCIHGIMHMDGFACSPRGWLAIFPVVVFHLHLASFQALVHFDV